MRTTFLLGFLLVAFLSVWSLIRYPSQGSGLLPNEEGVVPRETETVEANDPSEPVALRESPLSAGNGTETLEVPDRVRDAEDLLAYDRADDAAEVLQEGDLEDEDPVRYHLLQSEIYLLKGDFPMALGAADRVLEHDPDNVDALYQRAQARIGIEEYREAIEDITRVIALTADEGLRAHAIEQRDAWLEVYRPLEP